MPLLQRHWVKKIWIFAFKHRSFMLLPYSNLYEIANDEVRFWWQKEAFAILMPVTKKKNTLKYLMYEHRKNETEFVWWHSDLNLLTYLSLHFYKYYFSELSLLLVSTCHLCQCIYQASQLKALQNPIEISRKDYSLFFASKHNSLFADRKSDKKYFSIICSVVYQIKWVPTTFRSKKQQKFKWHPWLWSFKT